MQANATDRIAWRRRAGSLDDQQDVARRTVAERSRSVGHSLVERERDDPERGRL